MSKMPQEYFHPGTCDCEATELGKRYGKNLTPQLWDILVMSGLWPRILIVLWLRCEFPGLPVVRTVANSDMGLKFLDMGTIGKNWGLDNGWIAKKKTEGKVWAWVDQA